MQRTAMMHAMATVYVRLLGEGTLVYRPADADFVAPDAARLLAPPDYDGAVEAWEFAPGTLVHVQRRVLGGDEVYVAVAVVAKG